MQGTEVQGTYKSLFEGKIQNVIKCVNIDFESTREEVFNTLQLSVKGNDTIEDSIRQYVAVENLSGDNQYETSSNGKQDARKFIRFIELPPVLQISLNRYEYNQSSEMMEKNNQKFKFDDILDLESLIPVEQNQSSQSQSNWISSKSAKKGKSKKGYIQPQKVANRYRLLSILIHRGTVDSGHYYAFISPNITDDRWYEFNDSSVTQITKSSALMQGIGGRFSWFEPFKYGHQEYEESTRHLNLKYEENDTNAYMLIYIRESDIEELMSDRISVDRQIPKELQCYFQREEQLRHDIANDKDVYDNLKSVYVITKETIQYNDWDGPLITQSFRTSGSSDQEMFEASCSSHHLLYVDQKITINEFILTLRRRFFQDIPLEDIWIYRTVQAKIKNSSESCSDNYLKQFFYKFSFDPRCTQALFGNQKIQQQDPKYARNKLRNLLDSIYIYITINPLRGQRPVLEVRSDEKLESYKAHLQEYIDFIKRTDMIRGKQIAEIYQQWMQRGTYSFYSQSEASAEDDRTKSVRDHFIFQIDEALGAEFDQISSSLLANQPALCQDGDSEEISPNREFLCFVKLVKTQGRRLGAAKEIIVNANEPLNLNDIRDLYKEEETVERIAAAMVEPTSVHCLDVPSRSLKNKDSDLMSKDEDREACLLRKERGLICSATENGLSYFQLDTDVIPSIPASQFISRNGIILNLYAMSEADFSAYLKDPAAPEALVKRYTQAFKKLMDRVDLNLFEVMEPDDISKSEYERKWIGCFRFNYQLTFTQIIQKVAAYYNSSQQSNPEQNDNQKEGEMADCEMERESIQEHQIQFFDCNSEIVSYSKYQAFAANSSEANGRNDNGYDNLEYECALSMLKNQGALYFRILPEEIKFSNCDDVAEVVYKQADNKAPLTPTHECDIAERSKSVFDFARDVVYQKVQAFQCGAQQAEEKIKARILPLLVHKGSGCIKRIVPWGTPMHGILGAATALNMNEVDPFMLRFHQFDSYDRKAIKKILSENRGPIQFALCQLFNQFREKIGEQFVIPFGYTDPSHTFTYLIKEIQNKLYGFRDAKAIAGFQADTVTLYVLDFYQQQQARTRGARRASPMSEGPNLALLIFATEIDMATDGDKQIGKELFTEQLKNYYRMNESSHQFFHFAVVAQIDREQPVAQREQEEGDQLGDGAQSQNLNLN